MGAQTSRSTPRELVPCSSLQVPTELSGEGLGHSSSELLWFWAAKRQQVSQQAGRTKAQRLSGILTHSKLTWEERTPPIQSLAHTVAVCWVQSWYSLRPAALEHTPEFPG